MMSAFSSKFGTNYCPTDDEIHEINNLLLEPSHEIQHLDRKIAEIQKSLDDVVRQRTRLTEYVDAHKALLSPIRRVPLDILSEIFISCLPTERNCVMSPGEAPILLGHICSYWREIALSTPSLWASLHFVDDLSTLSSNRKQKAEQRLDAAIRWVGRSGKCPLSISIYGTGALLPSHWNDQTEEPPTLRFLQALVPLASRWTHLRFAMPSGNLTLFKRLSARDVPLLRSFSLIDFGGTGNSFDWTTGFPIEWLRGSRLEQVHIRQTYHLSPGHIPLRWEDLTVIDFDSYSNVFEVLVVLARCPRLISCGISVAMEDSETGMVIRDDPRGMVEISTLVELKLRTTGWSSSLELFDLLWLPNLRNFSFIAHSVSRDTLNIAAISRFFSPMHQLERFSIFPDPFPEGFVIGILHALPSTIHYLELSPLTRNTSHDYSWEVWQWGTTTSGFDRILSALLPSSNELYPLPQLQTLKLRSYHASEKAVVDLVQARMSVPESRLNHVDVTFQRPIEVDVEAALRPFMDEGLEVVVQVVHPEPVQFSPRTGLDDDF
ncbi:hypothetical protein C8F01DRAFT_1284860 [Mycena amicta]|nr:hypothetical protein C8F01DRAFT_1284860 [Mycena amicta]